MGDINYDKILNELESLMVSNPGGFTTTEMAEAVGRSLALCRRNLRKLIPAGIVHFIGHRRIKRIDGAIGQAPVYEYIKK